MTLLRNPMSQYKKTKSNITVRVSEEPLRRGGLNLPYYMIVRALLRNELLQLNKYFILFILISFFVILFPLLAFASKPYVETRDLLPNSGSVSANQTIIFSSTYYDSLSRWDIAYTGFMVNATSTFFQNSLQATYVPLLNKLYLLDDSGTKYLGGFSPGSNNQIQNSYCLLDCLKSSVSVSGNTLTVNWAVSFKPAFAGTKNLYLYIKGIFSGSDGWNNKGTITILSDTIAPSGTIKINNGNPYTNSSKVTLSLSAQDNPGGSGLSQMQFSNDGTVWSIPQPYAVSKTWDLSIGDGLKTVYVKFSDAAGNWSQVYSDSIILDTIAPELNITSPLDNAVVRP